MKTQSSERAPRHAFATRIRIAVALALSASAGLVSAAEDPAVTELTRPSSTVEVGLIDVSHDSYKFGEYNGLYQEGVSPVANLDLSGGGQYDSDNAQRFSLLGDNLGLRTSDLAADFRDQGLFKIDLQYGALRHNLSDTYQTYYLGAGSTSLSLPAGWLRPVVPQLNPTSLNFRGLSETAGTGSVVNSSGVVVAATPAQLATLDAIRTADSASLSHFNLHTQRKRGEVGFEVHLSPQWLLTASAQHETREGYHALGAVSSAIKENSVTIPDIIDTSTDQFNLGLQYTRQGLFFQAAYYGSIFHNDISSMSWQDPNDPTVTATMSSAPSNQLHQLSATGGYTTASGTRLVADISYGRGRQNEALLSDTSLPLGLPVHSADATVVTRLASLKLTTRLSRRIGLTARYKYDERDNRTPVATFAFYDVGLAPGATASAFNSALGLAPGTLASNVNIFSTRPQSRKTNEFNLSADAALSSGQRLTGGFDWQKIDRSCDRTWTNCVNAPESREHTFHVDWRAELTDTVDASVGYVYGERRVDYDSNAWLALAPMANVIPGGPVVGATTSVAGYLAATGLTGWGPVAGLPTTPLTGDAAIFSPNNNIVPQSLYGSRDNLADLPGMRRFNLADRDRNRVRAMLDWQVGTDFSTQLNASLDDDRYRKSVYGLQKSAGWVVGFDGTYGLGNRFSATVFYTHENNRSVTASDGFVANSTAASIGNAANTLVAGSCFQTVQSRNNNAKIDPCLNWSADMLDKADTIGLSLSRKELMAGRLELSGDIVFSRAVTDIGVTGGAYANNPFALAGAPPLGATVPAAFLIPAADLPSIVTRSFELRLGARYSISKASQVRIAYAYRRFKADDFAFEGLQVGTGTEQLPTGEQAPNFSVHAVGAFYSHRF